MNLTHGEYVSCFETDNITSPWPTARHCNAYIKYCYTINFCKSTQRGCLGNFGNLQTVKPSKILEFVWLCGMYKFAAMSVQIRDVKFNSSCKESATLFSR